MGRIAGASGETNGIARHVIPVAGKLHARAHDVALARVDRHGAGRALEYRERSVAIGSIDRSTRVGPVGVRRRAGSPGAASAVDRAVITATCITVPESQGHATGVDGIDLVLHAGLHYPSARRHGSDR